MGCKFALSNLAMCSKDPQNSLSSRDNAVLTQGTPQAAAGVAGGHWMLNCGDKGPPSRRQAWEVESEL